MDYPKLRIDYRDLDGTNCTSIVLDGKELLGIRRANLNVPRCDEGAPTLSLEIDVAAFERKEIPEFMK